MQQNDFPEHLIKGRIAETIFELMFREKTAFDVYPLGYEHITPILRQFRDHPAQQQREIIKMVIENLRDTPDFLLTLPDKSKVYLVEVKYRREASSQEIVNIAKKIHDRWHPVKLFLATTHGFYYESCRTIVENQHIAPLPESLIPADTQQYYLNLLLRFEK